MLVSACTRGQSCCDWAEVRVNGPALSSSRTSSSTGEEALHPDSRLRAHMTTARLTAWRGATRRSLFRWSRRSGCGASGVMMCNKYFMDDVGWHLLHHRSGFWIKLTLVQWAEQAQIILTLPPILNICIKVLLCLLWAWKWGACIKMSNSWTADAVLQSHLDWLSSDGHRRWADTVSHRDTSHNRSFPSLSDLWRCNPDNSVSCESE